MTSIILFLLIVPILGIILLSVNFILAPHNPYKEKKTPFECGYHSFLAQNRAQFTVSFFIFAILFLVFDIEITSLFPWIVAAQYNMSYGFFTVILFILILGLGFIFELGKNALKFDTKKDKLNIESNTASYVFSNTRYIVHTHTFVTTHLQSSIFDVVNLANGLNMGILADIDQLKGFIDRFDAFVRAGRFNVVMENFELGVDTGMDVSDELALHYANTVNVIAGLIHTKTHMIEDGLHKLIQAEFEIRRHDLIEYRFKQAGLEQKFGDVRSKFRHWN